MLGKLIKYDLKSMAKTCVPLLLAVFSAMLLIALILGINALFPEASALNPLSYTLIPVLFLGISGCSVAISFFIISRFYTSLMTDQGYLYFSLPVTASEHIWAKLLSSAIFFAVKYLVFILGSFSGICLFIILTKQYNVLTLMGEVFFKLFRSVFKAEYASQAFSILGLLFVNLCVVGLKNVFLFFYSFTIGGMAKKHNILTTICAVIVINIILNTVIEFIYSAFTIVLSLDKFSLTGFQVIVVALTLAVVLHSAAAILLYNLTKNKLTKKLNLN